MHENLRILVVDDNELIRKTLRRTLKGCDVVEAEHGLEALQILEEDGAFDVILSDMDMGTMNGAEFYTELRRRNVELSHRVVFCTGTYSPEHLAFIRGTLAPRVPKPFRQEELRHAISVIVGSP